MRKFLICMAVITVLTMMGGRAIAVFAFFDDNGVSLQAALNSVTIGLNQGKSSVDVLTDAISDNEDYYRAIHASGGSVNTLLIEVEAWASNNTFGIHYSADPLKRTMYAYQGKGIDTIQTFPFYPGNWDMEGFVLALEDLYYKHWDGGNGINDGHHPEWSVVEPDFSNFMVTVESVHSTSVPEPSTIFLVAGLVCVMLGMDRKKFIV